MLDINVYDMLVFEDETGSIYQDCVCAIKQAEYESITITRKATVVGCNDFILELNEDGTFEYIINRHEEDARKVFWQADKRHKYTLKEIWTRADEDTYKKKYVWSDEFKQLIPYTKGYVKSPNKIEVNI